MRYWLKQMLESIDVEHIRPYTRAKVQLNSGMNVLFGANGTGKTTLLESAYVTALTKSFRASRLADLIQKGQDYGRIQTVFQGHSLVVEFKQRGRQLRLDQTAVRKVEDFCQFFKVVLLAPEHIQLISGSPDNRRKYLDHILFFRDLDHLQRVRNYEKARQHKSALLKMELSWSDYQKQISPWHQQMCVWGNAIRSSRADLAKQIGAAAPSVYSEIAQTQDSLRLNYPSQQTLEQELQQMQLAEHSAKRVLCGPHRDDLEIEMNGQSMNSVASQGERASLLLALKFTEMDLLEHYRSECPTVLMLDDVGITLDADRRNQLFRKLESQDIQSLITTSDHQIAELCQNAGGQVYTKNEITSENGGAHVKWAE